MAENDNNETTDETPGSGEPQGPDEPTASAAGVEAGAKAGLEADAVDRAEGGPALDEFDPLRKREQRVEHQKSMFDKLSRLVKRRMPTLELIHERFARTVRLTLFNMIRSPVEVRVHMPMVKTYADFVNGFPDRTNINIVNIRSLRGIGCWCIAPQVIYTAIDNMFGGEGRIKPRSSIKEYTATELRIVRRIMDGLLNEYEKAWKSVYELKFDFMRQETNFTFAKITGPEEMVMHAKFTIDINGREGDVDLCIPFWVLEPLKTLLYENMQSFNSEPDEAWVEKLHSEVQSAHVQAVAVLARKEMALGDVLSMSVGEIIPIEISDPITVYVDGLPMIRGKYGVKNGRYSVKIDSIKHPVEYMKMPLQRGRLGPSMMRSEERGEMYATTDTRAGETLEAAFKSESPTAG